MPNDYVLVTPPLGKGHHRPNADTNIVSPASEIFGHCVKEQGFPKNFLPPPMPPRLIQLKNAPLVAHWHKAQSLFATSAGTWQHLEPNANGWNLTDGKPHRPFYLLVPKIHIKHSTPHALSHDNKSLRRIHPRVHP